MFYHTALLRMSSEAWCTVLSFISTMRMHLEPLETSPRLIPAKVNLINRKNGGMGGIDIGRFETLKPSCILQAGGLVAPNGVTCSLFKILFYDNKYKCCILVTFTIVFYIFIFILIEYPIS